MNYAHPYLQPYKGKSTRHTCPSCKTKQSFTVYLNGNSHEPIHNTVGRCNRESKCGYHYTPKQYFMDNSYLVATHHGRSNIQNAMKQITPVQPPGTIPFSYLIDSLSTQSNFVAFLKNHFSEEQIQKVFENYLLGATRNKEVIFWQIDIYGKVRTGKIMQYNPETGRRIKHQSGAIDWAHNKLKKSGTLPEDYNLQQCFFGEHLLEIHPYKPVAIVESEKSAIIASIIIPELVWLAAGNLNGLSIDKCKVLKNRDVMLYPDLGAFEKWSVKINEIQRKNGYKILISNLAENEAIYFDRANGSDIADYIISELK